MHRKQKELEEMERERKREEKLRKREQKQRDREFRRNQKKLEKLQAEEQKKLQEKIKLEERKLLLAQRNLQSIRLIAELLSRAKVPRPAVLLRAHRGHAMALGLGSLQPEPEGVGFPRRATRHPECVGFLRRPGCQA